MGMNLYEAAERFVRWLDDEVLAAGRGDRLQRLEVEPAGSFWLGRLASQEAVLELGLGERGERLDPCAIGMVLRPATPAPWRFCATVRARTWQREDGIWRKSELVEEKIPVEVQEAGDFSFGADRLAVALQKACGREGLGAVVQVDVTPGVNGTELAVRLVNISPSKHKELDDTNLYECVLEVSELPTEPFVLESLPDSFRYDRRVPAFGINCGVEAGPGSTLRTVDAIRVERGRPTYWNVSDAVPDFRFATLAEDPLPVLRELVGAMEQWGEAHWGEATLDARAASDLWTTAMREQARAAAADFAAERERLEAGIASLEADQDLLRAFGAMNRAMLWSANGKYDGWRPFQVGFLLANLASIVRPALEAETADIVWFATGGGKTETYLGLIVMAALYDRMRGKTGGITAWSRFPLRMLSLQQTQRFADAMAAAELQRRELGLDGEPFSVGFFVGDAATPNQVKRSANAWEADPDDPEMPGRYQVLLQCPFCHGASLEMKFDRRHWRLVHRCTNVECPWPDRELGLPFYIVDYEIYRFLPTVVVGTLDKAALIAQQAAMRGFVGAPWGRCSKDGHGYTYAPRSDRPHGCLVPGCRFAAGTLEMPAEHYAPSFRLQDELHLLKDSLGAVDAHYESLFDHLQKALSGRKPKILASSATLTGYDKQVRVLYQRDARAFPVPGPSAKEGFWTAESERLARRFVAVAPRGVTLEFAVDRTLTELQRSVRRLQSEPTVLCEAIGVDPQFAPELLGLYGVDVVYGNTLRDLEAAIRSLETQIAVDGRLNTESLTGRTEFEDVRKILQRLQEPEAEFDDRLHVIAASSMMSHGVDVDRLNVMTVLGLPLTTAEFIQTTARVGRRWPGLVFVMHKIARERDASVYRAFEQFVRQGDRFVEPVPVTRRSRRVLERTVAGMTLARINAIHEPASEQSLVTIGKLRDYVEGGGTDASRELEALVDTLGLSGELDESLRADLQRWLNGFFRNLLEPAGSQRFPSDLCPWGKPMRSLRDVEEQAPVRGTIQ